MNNESNINNIVDTSLSRYELIKLIVPYLTNYDNLNAKIKSLSMTKKELYSFYRNLLNTNNVNIEKIIAHDGSDHMTKLPTELKLCICDHLDSKNIVRFSKVSKIIYSEIRYSKKYRDIENSNIVISVRRNNIAAVRNIITKISKQCSNGNYDNLFYEIADALNECIKCDNNKILYRILCLEYKRVNGMMSSMKRYYTGKFYCFDFTLAKYNRLDHIWDRLNSEYVNTFEIANAAVKYRNKTILNILLSSDSDVVIISCIKYGWIEYLDNIIKNLTSIEIDFHDVLSYALSYGQLKIVKYILQYNFDTQLLEQINNDTLDSYDMLYLAIMSNDISTINFVKNVFNITHVSNFTLFYMLDNGYYDTFEHLVMLLGNEFIDQRKNFILSKIIEAKNSGAINMYDAEIWFRNKYLY